MMNLPGLSNELFVYGTLRKDPSHQMYRLLSRHSTFVGDGTIRGELYDLGEYPGVHLAPTCSKSVIGEVYRLDPSHAAEIWRNLDAYEGCGDLDPEPHEYERRRVRVTFADGSDAEAWAYILPTLPLGAVKVPSGDYLAWREMNARQFPGHSGSYISPAPKLGDPTSDDSNSI